MEFSLGSVFLNTKVKDLLFLFLHFSDTISSEYFFYKYNSFIDFLIWVSLNSCYFLPSFHIKPQNLYWASEFCNYYGDFFIIWHKIITFLYTQNKFPLLFSLKMGTMWLYSLKLVFRIQFLEIAVRSRPLSQEQPVTCMSFTTMISESQSNWRHLFSWKHLSKYCNNTRLYKGWLIDMKTKGGDQGGTW